MAASGLPLADLLEQVAARRPAPGGGSSAAWACALAAALIEMAGAFAPEAAEDGSGDPPALTARARALREGALALAERELGSYAPVLEAMRREPGPERDELLRAALDEAAAAPLAIAGCAAEVAELGLIALDSGSEHLRGDAVTGVLLAEAACASAAQLVALDLATMPDDPRHAEARRSGEVAAAARRRALGASNKQV